jgi:hypothetical protein
VLPVDRLAEAIQRHLAGVQPAAALSGGPR